MEEITNYGDAGAEQNGISLELPDLKVFTNWATFNAIINIIFGALSCLGFIVIIPAVYGIIQIIAGVKLLNASDEMKRHIDTGDIEKVRASFYNLSGFFKLNGIAAIIKICSAILLLILYGVLLTVFMPYIRDYINNYTDNMNNLYK